MEYFRYTEGTVPVLLSVPHAGTHVPEAILGRLSDNAKRLPDTDWHVDRLYAFAAGLGVHMLAATHSRYVVDLNRDPADTSLYPGQFTTGLCPATLFDGSPLYLEGMASDAAEIKERTATYWQPYHDKIRSVIAELKQKHGRCLVFDAHSIASHVPKLFEGQLPDLNIGTADGKTADAKLAEALVECCRNSPYSAVYNGRFKGGYITRHYGSPENGVQSVQLELAQCNYMDESYPFAYDEIKASKLQGTLQEFVQILVQAVS